MPCIGRVFRVFNPREPDYYDNDVHEYLVSIGSPPENLTGYVVVPKRAGLSRQALSRYDRKVDPFSPKIKHLYDIAGDWLEKEFGPHMCNSRVLSLDEVMEWLHSDKSPGYPETLKYPTKADYYASSDFASLFPEYLRRLETDDYIRSLCSVTIKEEVRPRMKVERGEVRTIVAMDTNHVIAHCMYCLHQNNSMIKTHLLHSSTLGINIFESGFHRLNEKMMRFGSEPCTIELDGKKFDGRFREYCFHKIRDFRFKMLASEFRTPSTYKILTNLYNELVFSPLVDVDGFVFAREAGNPSGQACTTPDNTLKNWMDMVVLWHLIMPDEYHNFESFRENLVMCVNGDDINLSVHPDIHHLFCAKRIEDNMALIDMEYHFASMDFRCNYDCTFLGHGFRLTEIPGLGYARYLPVIDCERMRTNMLIDNEAGTPANCIVRACGLRNETFACEDCRVWFLGLIEFLRVKYPIGYSMSTDQAWLNYKTDRDLWEMYTGIKAIAVQ